MSIAIPDPLLPHDHLQVTAWSDPVIDTVGHDPRSVYVETFWLGILGPSSTWLIRRLAAGLDAQPEGFALPLAETARSLGLSAKNGRHSPFVRSFVRCCQFGLAQGCGSDGLAVRRKLPPLNRHQVKRLPATLQDAHRRWQEAELRPPEQAERLTRARRLALSLLEIGEDRESAEHQLHRWKFHPAMAAVAVGWAVERQRHAAEAKAAAAPAPGGVDSLGGDAA